MNNFSTNNREAIKDITKPCEILVKDIYHKEPSPYNENSKKCTLAVDDLSVSASDLQEIKDNQKLIVPYSIDYKPEGLQNPSNHCYLNSILQILHRILITVDDELYINNNTEGNLVKFLMEAIRQSSSNTLADFKIQLQLYDSFFDGNVQRDALECLNLLLDLIHKGTKQSLIDLDGSMLENDELVTSITKQLFSHTLKKTLICVNCNNSTEYFIQSYNHNVYPDTNSHISDLLRKCMSGTVTKSCTICLHDTNHTEVIKLEQDPKILMIVINRFDSRMTSRKNTTKVKISSTLRLNSSSYHLIASAHHHGRSTFSGHYTSNIVIGNAVYFCNDHYIRSSDFVDDNSSNSAYIVLYSSNDI